MEEAPENGKESSHCAYVSGMNEWMNTQRDSLHKKKKTPTYARLQYGWTNS